MGGLVLHIILPCVENLLEIHLEAKLKAVDMELLLDTSEVWVASSP
jgi:hypothetical protein